eukprot:scaffold1058_cov362-Prasinococcus_capsulatus_cf.AAC.13
MWSGLKLRAREYATRALKSWPLHELHCRVCPMLGDLSVIISYLPAGGRRIQPLMSSACCSKLPLETKFLLLPCCCWLAPPFASVIKGIRSSNPMCGNARRTGCNLPTDAPAPVLRGGDKAWCILCPCNHAIACRSG